MSTIHPATSIHYRASRPPIPLHPGDHLIYTGIDPIDLAIMIKTGSRAAHIEIYYRDGMSLASRNGQGIGKYPLRLSGLCYVLRPIGGNYNMTLAMDWFWDHANGKPYAWLDLINFYLPGAPLKTRGMICSQFAALFDRAARGEHIGPIRPISPIQQSFQPRWPAAKISPADFLKSDAFTWAWVKR